MHSVPTKILMSQYVPKKSAILACLKISKLKLNQPVPNKNTDLLKKNQLNGTELMQYHYHTFFILWLH